MLLTAWPMGAGAQAYTQALTVERAISEAMKNNPSVAAARYDLRASEASVRAQQGARGPIVDFSVQGRHNEGFSAAGDGLTTNEQDQVSASVGASLLTDLGTSIGVGVSTDVNWRATNLDPSRTTIYRVGPIYSGALTLDIRQPLFRDAGTDAALGPIRVAEATELATRRSLEQSVSQLAMDVQVAHRELWYAQEALALAEQSLALAERQANEAQQRLSELGTTSRIEVLRFESELASAQRSKTAAQAEVQTRAVELGRLLGLPSTEVTQVRAMVRDVTPVAPAPASVLVEAARANSSELLAREADVVAAQVRLDSADNADQIQLDVIAQLSASVLFNEDTIDTLQLPGDRPAFGGMLGIEGQIPIGESQQGAAFEQAAGNYQASLARYESTEQQVAANVARARTALVSAAERVELSSKAAQVAKDLADAERARVQLGTATALEVLQAQQNERASELEKLRAQADYANGEVQLAHLTGALLATVEGKVQP